MLFLTFKITYSRPYFLFLLIPFLLFTVLPYFTMAKRYRKTRNRITSMVLHGITSILVIFVLSGMLFERTIPNAKNEIILCVDVSDTENQSSETRDEFVQTIINQAKFDNFKIGIVTFGYDQTYAVKLTREYDKIYKNYKEATLPDVSATNIAQALTYTKDLFTESDSKKIVLITDGKETDENAKSIIKSVVASGISVDTVSIPSSYDGDDMQISSVTLPDYHIGTNEDCSISFTINSNYESSVGIKLYDNGVFDSSNELTLDIKEGENISTINHRFDTEGLHEITLKITDLSNDLVLENNSYSTYLYLENFNKILILEQRVGDSTSLVDMLTTDNAYTVDVKNVLQDKLPTSPEELCNYDEVIMNNIANEDLPEGFVDILYDYVYNYGGGLFTTGGTDEAGESHAYNRNDMVGTKYQSMLPVQAINYTPPVGVIVIIDRSGSMSIADDYGNSLLDYAKAGAISCLNALTERDYFGVMTLDSDYDTMIQLTPRTQESTILQAIEAVGDATGGTVFPGAIDRAGQALRALKNVDKKHIIIVSDGQVPTSEVAEYEAYAKNYYETDGITISVIGVDMKTPGNASQMMSDSYPVDNIGLNTPFDRMLRLCKLTGGTLHPIGHTESSKIVSDMREDLNAPEIKEVNYEEFFPSVSDVTANIFSDVTILKDEEHSNTLSFTLSGFFGVKSRASSQNLINGDYNVPIYSQWKFGRGMVGSFMCDLYGEWSSELFKSSDGKQLIYNIIDNLTPTENIRVNDIKLVLNEDNYTNSLSVYTTLDIGEIITGKVIFNGKTISLNEVIETTDKSMYTKQALGIDNNYTRCKFVLKEPGAYTIEITRVKQDGTITGKNTIYKSIAYSEEYDTTTLTDDELNKNINLLKSLSLSGNGSFIQDLEDPHEIIDSFNVTLTKTYDPRILFAIVSLICFLIDIAIRKFKFKWPHELINDYKNRKSNKFFKK